ncbi:hypothetical protein TNCV_371991 [Trichonephila clavipes]|nr:hypothetical protein TNCV_371991 [Trichonephila clavipes]
MTAKDVLECVLSSRNIFDTDSDDENASPVLKSSEMRNIMKKIVRVHYFVRGGFVGVTAPVQVQSISPLIFRSTS